MLGKSYVLALFFLAACGTTVTYAPTNTAPHGLTRRAPEQVAVFTTSVPDRPYAELGILQARQASEFSADRLPEVIVAMKEEAAEIGCDGVIIHGRADAVQGAIGSHQQNTFGRTRTLEGMYGTCIVFVEASSVSVADRR